MRARCVFNVPGYILHLALHSSPLYFYPLALEIGDVFIVEDETFSSEENRRKVRVNGGDLIYSQGIVVFVIELLVEENAV